MKRSLKLERKGIPRQGDQRMPKRRSMKVCLWGELKSGVVEKKLN